MKTFNKLLAISLAALTVTSCADLDAEHQSYYVTTDEKQEAAAMNSDVAQAAVTGCFANFSTYMTVLGNHSDFGFPSIMIGLDLMALDTQTKYTGYNWHLQWERYDDPNLDSDQSYMVWRTMYNQIYTTNALIPTIDEESASAELQFYLAQGYALRAFDYFVLAQCYAFNYEGHESDACVPIITEENQEDAAANGVARSSVEEVYAQIISDIDHAIQLLESSGLEPEDVISTKPHRLVGAATAYGLRARINLVMHKYTAAADDAQKAIELFSGRPYTDDEVLRPAFNSLTDDAWMWGIAIAETDRVVTSGIVNWPSFMVSFASGYVNYGAWKYCGYQLYSYIPDTDVRKGWFLDDNYQSDHLTSLEQEYLNTYIPANGPIYGSADSSSSLFPQTNVKFASYEDAIQQSVNANDIPLMRIEEMYLTLAEAKGMSSLSEGKQLLQNFVQTYRDEAYTCTATDTQSFVDECWMQRRIELWGEGISFFDLKRLGKPMDRSNNRTCYRYRFKIQPDDPVLNFCVPRDETTANPKISVDQAGTISTSPQPFREEIDG